MNRIRFSIRTLLIATLVAAGMVVTFLFYFPEIDDSFFVNSVKEFEGKPVGELVEFVAKCEREFAYVLTADSPLAANQSPINLSVEFERISIFARDGRTIEVRFEPRVPVAGDQMLNSTVVEIRVPHN